MGYFGKLEEKSKAIKLRRAGLSYSQIKEEIHVSKSTLSLWCRNIELNSQQKDALDNIRKRSAIVGLRMAARKKIEERIAKTKQIHLEAIAEIGDLSKRDRFIAGVALYLGDGYKTDQRFGFSNSNPKVVKMMLNWLLEFTSVKKREVRGRIWLHDDLDEEKARKFWSEYLGISDTNFTKSYLVKNKDNSKKIRKNIHQFGVFSLIINKKDLQEKMIGFMTGILPI